MEPDCTWLVVLETAERFTVKTQKRCLSPEIMTQLLKIIHRHGREQFHVETVFFLPLLGNVYLLTEDRLANSS